MHLSSLKHEENKYKTIQVSLQIIKGYVIFKNKNKSMDLNASVTKNCDSLDFSCLSNT